MLMKSLKDIYTTVISKWARLRKTNSPNPQPVGRRYSLTRFKMYNSLENFIKQNNYKGKVLLISEGNEHSIRNMFPQDLEFVVTSYPQVDIMDLSQFPELEFEVVVSDQILEHVAEPWRALQQINRILKQGGIVVTTSCSFNNVHDSVDYYRFMPDGLRYLHEKYVGKVLFLDYWGNRESISLFAGQNYRCFDVRSDGNALRLAELSEPLWPWHVWCIAQKP